VDQVRFLTAKEKKRKKKEKKERKRKKQKKKKKEKYRYCKISSWTFEPKLSTQNDFTNGGKF